MNMFIYMAKKTYTQQKRLLLFTCSITVLISMAFGVAEAASKETPGYLLPDHSPNSPHGPYADETPEAYNQRMSWWREARFGLFIHWGTSSMYGGEYKGKPIKGPSEWLLNNAKVPIAEYRKTAAGFNPTKFDPKSIVLLAKQAGMKYIVITAKHHDGFCMFDSPVTDWDIMDAAPFKRDVIKELANATRAEGLRFGFYYSHAQDWIHPGGATIGEPWDPAQKGDFNEYSKNIAVPHIKNLLTNYGKISVLWWDLGKRSTLESVAMLEPLIGLQPDLISNDRLYDRNNARGDTQTHEQGHGAAARTHWECCMTMGGSWGYKKSEEITESVKPTEVLLSHLVHIAGTGGNFLLNIGPTPEGLVPKQQRKGLEEIGEWMKRYGHTIYGSVAGPWPELPFGACTMAPAKKGRSTLYLHITDWPEDNRLVLHGLKNKIISARNEADKAPLEVVDSKGNLSIDVANIKQRDPWVSVVAVEIEGKPDVDLTKLPIMPAIMPGPDGRIVLEGAAAKTPKKSSRTSVSVKGDILVVKEGVPRGSIGKWRAISPEGGSYNVSLEVRNGSSFGSNLRLQANGSKNLMQFDVGTDTKGEFVMREGGVLEIPAGILMSFSANTSPILISKVKPEQREQGRKDNGKFLYWGPVEIRRIILTPTE